eukprot:14662685-Alexandrium_andersonii.AAC.1
MHFSTTSQPRSRRQQQLKQLPVNVSVFESWHWGLRPGKGCVRMQWGSLSFASDSEEAPELA